VAKGLVDERSFIKDWLLIHWQGILAVALIPAFIIAWKIIIKRKSGSRVIVPHYEPARGMKPAEVEYFFHGFNSADRGRRQPWTLPREDTCELKKGNRPKAK
jgi:hypothetical protein